MQMDDGDIRRRRGKHQRSLAYKACLTKKDASKEGKWVIDICGEVESLELAISAPARLRGLLFRDPDKITRLLIPCKDIHTFGMRYPLDVAFISKDGDVLEVHRNVATMQRIKNKDAVMVAERFSRSGEWLMKGDVIHLGSR